MTPAISDAVKKALKALPLHMTSPEAFVLIYAIGFQESKFQHRYQVLNSPGIKGPARGFWQFERGGGVVGIMNHSSTASYLKKYCALQNIPFASLIIWTALEKNDVLAALCARLLLYSDPHPLPQIGDRNAAWNYYIRNWRPGKPHPELWSTSYSSGFWMYETYHKMTQDERDLNDMLVVRHLNPRSSNESLRSCIDRLLTYEIDLDRFMRSQDAAS